MDGVTRFWDLYEGFGIEEAVEWLRSEYGTEISDLAEAVPHLIAEAKDRNIDMIEFLEKLDEVENAARTDNDASELRSDSGDEADESQDADESAPAPDADGEDRSEDESSSGSSDV